MGGRHEGTLIFLHGLGDTNEGWHATWREEVKIPGLRVLFPQAPRRPVTLNFGMRMPAWYDIYSLDETDKREDETGMLASARHLHDLIEKETLPKERIFVGGFSQGAVIAILAGLSYVHKLGGIISLSGYLPLRNSLASHIKNRPPIWMAHGTADPVIQPRWSHHSRDKLKELGVEVQWMEYPGMAHGCCPKELRDLKTWLEHKLK